MSAESSRDTRLWYAQGEVRRWNRLHPVGTVVAVRLKNGSTADYKTRSPADVFKDTQGEFVGAVYLEGVEPAISLADCLPEIPKEVKFLCERYPAEELRRKLEWIRDGEDLSSNFFRLAKHWEYEIEKATPEEAAVYRRCIKQLKQRAEWLREELDILETVLRVAPHLRPKEPNPVASDARGCSMRRAMRRFCKGVSYGGKEEPIQTASRPEFQQSGWPA